MAGHQQETLRALRQRNAGVAGDTDGIQAPEGVAENTMPSLSMASTQVVSFAISASSIL